ncbi:hypothetical protein ACS0TY_032792 [Phlomoides rotata]
MGAALYSANQASRIKRLTALNLRFSVRRYKQQQGKSDGVHEERAPSTAEEFERVAEEKSRLHATQTPPEKAQDDAADSVKEAPPGKGNFDKTGDQR